MYIYMGIYGIYMGYYGIILDRIMGDDEGVELGIYIN